MSLHEIRLTSARARSKALSRVPSTIRVVLSARRTKVATAGRACVAWQAIVVVLPLAAIARVIAARRLVAVAAVAAAIIVAARGAIVVIVIAACARGAGPEAFAAGTVHVGGGAEVAEVVGLAHSLLAV